MKKSILGKWMFFVFCAMAGSLTGYGIVSLADADDGKVNNSTKDNTLVREVDDSVFFDENEDVTLVPMVTTEPVEQITEREPVQEIFPTVAVEPAETVSDEKVLGQAAVTVIPEPEVMPEATIAPEPTPTPTPVPTQTPVPTPAVKENTSIQTITYPAKIFGQTPVVNRSDAYVTYFEFCIDLIEAIEPEVDRRSLNETSLITKFVFKALLCGVDVQKVKINDPIPREMAALAMWLAAQVMDEAETDTSSKQVTKYVTDIGKCSGSEKKAVAYLYEQGIVSGYQVSGQTFCPNQNLRTEDGIIWMERAKQCWK